MLRRRPLQLQSRLFFSGGGKKAGQTRILASFIFVMGLSVNLAHAQSVLDALDKKNLREFFSFPAKSVVQSYRTMFGKGIKSFCPMKPSCSAYGLQALDEYGSFRGSLAIVDRLNRCGHDLFLYPHEPSSKGIYFIDPVHKEWRRAVILSLLVWSL